MKTTIRFFSSLLVFVTSFLVASAANDKVLDIDGQELRTGTSYYILPVERSNVGGGLSSEGHDCPVSVVQTFNVDDRGTAVTFTLVDPKEATIGVSEDLNIKSSDKSCAPANVWKIDGGQRFVSTGGVLGNPGPDTISNWFRIEKVQGRNNSHKLVYCPSVCNASCRPVCGDLGVVQLKTGTIHLALNTGSPLQVFFQKA
ncbi:Kunitz trypsin inhibitor 2 [Heracleum sosnowskyi]|uniref:Kunitz trypsin inhibitor 2 n=1 Tax=Heracleum sosnowskyi TaxID=360622 RepID=A0AAD8NDE0_9APIA|nr:Kunitz trypsin inhibitor 2 [Heracleum sosnowskyi]